MGIKNSEKKPEPEHLMQNFLHALHNFCPQALTECSLNPKDLVYQHKEEEGFFVLDINCEETLKAMLWSLLINDQSEAIPTTMDTFLTHFEECLKKEYEGAEVQVGDQILEQFAYEDLWLAIAVGVYGFNFVYDLFYGEWTMQKTAFRFWGYFYGMWFISLLTNASSFPFKSQCDPFAIMTCNMSQYKSFNRAFFRYTWWGIGLFEVLAAMAVAWTPMPHTEEIVESDHSGWFTSKVHEVITLQTYYGEAWVNTFLFITLVSCVHFVSCIMSAVTIYHDSTKHETHVTVFGLTTWIVAGLLLYITAEDEDWWMIKYSSYLAIVMAASNSYNCYRMVVLSDAKSEFISVGQSALTHLWMTSVMLEGDFLMCVNFAIFWISPILRRILDHTELGRRSKDSTLENFNQIRFSTDHICEYCGAIKSE